MFRWLMRRRREALRRRPLPAEWRAKYPALYGQLQQFYRQDPAALALSP